MGKYASRYVHKISSSLRDVGPDIELDKSTLTNRVSLGKALRDGKILEAGGRIDHFRVEADKQVVVFPLTGIWHSIILTPKE